MPFADENVVRQIPKNDTFQAGVSNVDAGAVYEKSLRLPYPTDPEATWIYYECAVGCMLDSGIVVHNRLPQVNNTADSLGSVYLDDPGLDKALGSVNMACQDQYQDIVQRMGHARYWFRLWGMALRVGLPIPIPKLREIGGVPAIPYDKNPQWAWCAIAPGANMGGVPLWRAMWSLWYTTAVPPTGGRVPAVEPAASIDDLSALPKDVQAPWSLPDDDAVSSAPTAEAPTTSPNLGGNIISTQRRRQR